MGADNNTLSLDRLLCELAGRLFQQKLRGLLCLREVRSWRAFLGDLHGMNRGVKWFVCSLFLAKFQVPLCNYSAFQVALEMSVPVPVYCSHCLPDSYCRANSSLIVGCKGVISLPTQSAHLLPKKELQNSWLELSYLIFFLLFLNGSLLRFSTSESIHREIAT